MINKQTPYEKFCFKKATHADIWRRPLSAKQTKIYNLARVGWKAKKISGRVNISPSGVADALVKIKSKGWAL